MTVLLEPWSEGDLELVRRLNAPEMTAHLGGPEPEEKLGERQLRYAGLAATGTGEVFKIVELATRRPAGQIAYWERVWQDEDCYEMGWGVFPEFQGRGLASAAVKMALERIAGRGRRRLVHAFPNVENAASNALCRKAGFDLRGEVDFEYPPGRSMRCCDWAIRL